MAAIKSVFTVARVAEMLGEDAVLAKLAAMAVDGTKPLDTLIEAEGL